ncbi:MAG: 30S ribosomal protein S16 [Phycisphaerales bacterium]|nr:30S ribosomal protein S16 [Phycisphaerales bacterium]
MAVKIRLKRFGRRHRAVYRVTAVDSRNPRDGRVLEELGTYDPDNANVDQQIRLNAERIGHWLKLGAVPSDTVRQMIKRHGIKAS